MKTKEIQAHLLNYLKNRNDFFVLTTNYSWNLLFEADVFQINRKREIIEFEIKASRGDFLKDKEKSKEYYVPFDYNVSKITKQGFLLGNEIIENKNFKKHRPNKFYYVCYDGLIKKDEIHKSFGIINILQSGQVYQSKRAKYLHEDINADDMMSLEVARNFCIKNSQL